MTTDVSINLPTEYFDALSEVIRTGLERASISAEDRQNLKAWWEAEREFILDDLNEK